MKGRAQCPATSFLTGVIGCDNKSIFMGAGSRFVLEKVPGVNLYRIRMQASRAGGADGAAAAPHQLAGVTSRSPARQASGARPGLGTHRWGARPLCTLSALHSLLPSRST